MRKGRVLLLSLLSARLRKLLLSFTVAILAILILLWVGASPVYAATLSVVLNPVATTSANETNPTLGSDGTGDLVVYTLYEILPTGMPDQADIYYQRLDGNGAPVGAPVQVTTDLTNDLLNDVSGDYIV